MKKTRLTHILSIAAVTLTAAILFSCSSEDKDTESMPDNRDSLPVLMSVGVSSVVSDSGIVSYKIISEDWYYYDKTPEPYHAFEKGLFLEKFDKSFHVVAFISCDTAYHFENKRLWELRGRVLVKNMKGETFKTSLLYWDMGTHRIYSDRFMRIDGQEQQLSGYNFSSNEMMTEYRIYGSEGAFPLDDDSPTSNPEFVEGSDTTISKQ